MKAALEAWGAGSNLFHQGVAKETDDPEVVAATMSKPGVVLKRPAGSNGRFAEHAGLPTDLGDDGGGTRKKVRSPPRRPAPEISKKDALKAAADFEHEQKRRDAERRKEKAAREKERARREKLVARAQAALDNAQREHQERAESLEAERAAIEKRIEAEDGRWENEKERLTAALRRALG
jgi:colicin import membrane protein